MKNYAVIVFFSVVSTLYLLLNLLVVSRGAKALEGTGYVTLFRWIYWILALTFIVGQVLERGNPTLFGRIVTHIGSVWLAIFWYFLFFLLLIDIVRVFNHWFHFIPQNVFSTYSNGVVLFFSVVVVSVIITIAGYFNARYPRVHNVDIQVDKKVEGLENLKIVFVSDIHMGAIVGNKRIAEMVDRINSLNPDLVLFGGDLVDHNPLFVKAEGMGKHFLKLKPKYGVFAVTGNHEFIGHPEISIDYLQQFGIQYIRDTVVNIENLFLVAGRDDKDKKNFGSNPRKKLDEVLNGCNPSLPLILMDHQPVEYAQAEKLGVDLMLSGHTHKGQIWPFGFITRKVYENDFGLIQKGKTWFYTSCGYGFWGPPIRTGNRPEIVLINMRMKSEK